MSELRKLPALLLALALLFAMVGGAYAHDVPDMTRKGAISLKMEFGGRPVPGGTFALYRVGDIAENDGSYGFKLTDEFEGSDADLSDISSAGLAQALAEYAAGHSISGQTEEIGGDGKVTVSGLTLGLYLLVQSRAAGGYEPVKPFLVSLPLYEDGAYKYEVDATPKMGTLTETPHHHDPEPTATVVPGAGGSKLPQSGQLNWPVPVLAAVGMCLFLLGFALRFGEREKPYEA